MANKKYSDLTEYLIREVGLRGLNIWAMLGLFKKRSKLNEPIPEEVIQEVCREYLKKEGKVYQEFPYFITVLRKKSEEYFAKRNIREHAQYKKESLFIGNIFKELANK